MTQTSYLILTIAVLCALGALALLLFFLLRRGPKTPRPKCASCQDLSCPLAKAMEEKRNDDTL